MPRRAPSRFSRCYRVSENSQALHQHAKIRPWLIAFTTVPWSALPVNMMRTVSGARCSSGSRTRCHSSWASAYRRRLRRRAHPPARAPIPPTRPPQFQRGMFLCRKLRSQAWSMFSSSSTSKIREFTAKVFRRLAGVNQRPGDCVLPLGRPVTHPEHLEVSEVDPRGRSRRLR